MKFLIYRIHKNNKWLPDHTNWNTTVVKKASSYAWITEKTFSPLHCHSIYQQVIASTLKKITNPRISHYFMVTKIVSLISPSSLTVFLPHSIQNCLCLYHYDSLLLKTSSISQSHLNRNSTSLIWTLSSSGNSPI